MKMNEVPAHTFAREGKTMQRIARVSITGNRELVEEELSHDEFTQLLRDPPKGWKVYILLYDPREETTSLPEEDGSRIPTRGVPVHGK